MTNYSIEITSQTCHWFTGPARALLKMPLFCSGKATAIVNQEQWVLDDKVLSPFDPKLLRNNNMSHVMRKPAMWFPNKSNTKRAVQAQKMT